MSDTARLDAEWVTLSAVRGMAKIALKGDIGKSTYDNALALGGELYPAMLGPESSILRRHRESDTTTEYRQRARVKSMKRGATVEPLDLVRDDIEELRDLLEVAKQSGQNRGHVDQLKRRLGILVETENELKPVPHTENQLIFRDAHGVERAVPAHGTGRGYRDFQLPDSNILRVRVLHPDKPEHVTGADIVYERHSPRDESASIVAVQYKIWENKSMYLTDTRMARQMQNLQRFICDKTLCSQPNEAKSYRFPCCAAFLRPTDKLQKPDQAFVSTGEHIPICRIDQCKTAGARGAALLEYKNMRGISLSSEMFEGLFNTGKIGSRQLSYDELAELYHAHEVASEEDTVVIYLQEFSDTSRGDEQ
jgi:hypothetical protein